MESIHGCNGNLNRVYMKPFIKSEAVNIKTNAPSDMSPKVDLPIRVNLREKAKVEIYDQGQTGSCSANAICASYSLLNMLNSRPAINLSRMFIYYNSRVPDNEQGVDSGAHLFNSFNSMALQGCCQEAFWPFQTNLLTICPPGLCYQEALKHCTQQQNTRLNPTYMLYEIKRCIANNLPVVISILVYSSFESQLVAETGMIPLPNVQAEQLLGGHALLVLGYDDIMQVVVIQNSWSDRWGDNGIGYLPYAFISNPNLTWDCHSFTEVEIDRSLNPRNNM